MPGPLLLIDSDVFLTLAGSGLLDRTIELLGFTPEQCRRLDALPYMIQKNRRIYEAYSAACRNDASAACDRIPAITDEPPLEEMESLSAVDEIDSGEAFLYAHLSSDETWLLVSGDKRAMRAIATDPNVATIRASIAGRVLSLECILKKLVEEDGVALVFPAIEPVRETNMVLRTAFSDSHDDSQCIAALDSYLNKLKTDVGPDFLYER